MGRAATFGLLLALAGCGFQLQGRQQLPAALHAASIETVDSQSEFTHALREAIAASGGSVVEAGAQRPEGSATIDVTRDSVTERVLTVSSRNIPTDYELTYLVEIAVHGDGVELLARETFTLSRVYSFDETRLLAKEREKDILVQALARDMASVVARRLAAL